MLVHKGPWNINFFSFSFFFIKKKTQRVPEYHCGKFQLFLQNYF